jgi:hypothetical protein
METESYQVSFLVPPQNSQCGRRRSIQSRIRERLNLSRGTSSASSPKPSGSIQSPKIGRKLKRPPQMRSTPIGTLIQTEDGRLSQRMIERHRCGRRSIMHSTRQSLPLSLRSTFSRPSIPSRRYLSRAICTECFEQPPGDSAPLIKFCHSFGHMFCPCATIAYGRTSHRLSAFSETSWRCRPRRPAALVTSLPFSSRFACTWGWVNLSDPIGRRPRTPICSHAKTVDGR